MGGDDALAHARDETGACWFFNSGCRPPGFVEVDGRDLTCNASTAASVLACQ